PRAPLVTWSEPFDAARNRLARWRRGNCAASCRRRSLPAKSPYAFQFRHPLAEQPKGLVQLGILINTVDGTGFDAARPAEIVVADPAQPALDRVFLHHVPDSPEIVGAVVVTAGYGPLLLLNRRLGFALAVTKAENMGWGCVNVPFVAVQPQG